MHRMAKLATTLIVASILAYALTAWAASQTCKAGKPCVCRGSKSCNFTCKGKGCKFDVTGSGNAALFCKKGHCSANIQGSGDVKFVCNGGKCKVKSMGSGTTLLDCPGKGCSMTCIGSGDCRLLGCKKCPLKCIGSATCRRTIAATTSAFGVYGN